MVAPQAVVEILIRIYVPAHEAYPRLLRGWMFDRPNQV
jgi:hypothetical protein